MRRHRSRVKPALGRGKNTPLARPEGSPSRYALVVADLLAAWCVPVVRADFRDDGVWEQLKDEIVSPMEEGFVASVEFVEDRTLIGLARRQSRPAALVPTRAGIGTRWCSSSTPSPSRCRSGPCSSSILTKGTRRARSGRCHGRSRQSTTCRLRTWTSLSSHGRQARMASFEAFQGSAAGPTPLPDALICRR